MSAGKTLNTGNALFSNIVRALSGDVDLPVLRALDGGSDTITQPTHQVISVSEPTATWTSTQGIARDASNWFAINTGTIRKYDLSSNLLITNSSPFTSLPAGLDHCGDGFVDGLYLYVALSNYSAGTSTVKVIAKYLVSTLVLDSYFDLVAQTNLNCSGCTLNEDGTEILVTSFFVTVGSDQRNTDLYRFDKSTGSFLGINTLSVPSVGIQSITYHSDDKYYLGSFDITNTLNKIYVYDNAFTYITTIDPSDSGTEMEGVESFDDVLYFNNIGGSPRVVELSNVYIPNVGALSDAVQFLDNSLITDQVTIMMKLTFHSLFNFNTVIDNLSYGNDWESWIYATGELAWRVSSTGRTSKTGLVAGQEYIVAFTWDHTTTVNIKTGVDGVYGSQVTTAWVTPPAAGLYLAGINTANNNLGDNRYRDILVFDKVLSPTELLDSYNNFDDFYIDDGIISITEQTTNTNYASLDPVISLTGTISITENLVNTNYTSLNPTIDLTGIVLITETLVNTSYTGLNPSITLTPTGVIVVNEQLVNTSYTSLNPTIDLTGLVDITENLVNANYIALNPVITLTSGAIEIVEQTVNTQYQAKNPSILLTPEPLGIVSTVCFDGVLVKVEFNGLQNNLEYSGKSINIEFNGNFNELEFNGTIQTTCNPGSIKTNC